MSLDEEIGKPIEGTDLEPLKYLMEVAKSNYDFQEASILVHPGYSEYVPWYDPYPSISGGGYNEYRKELQEKVEELKEKNAPIVTLHPRGRKEETLDFLQVDEEDLYLVETEPEPSSFFESLLKKDLSPAPTSQGKKRLLAILPNIVDANSQVPVSGEVKGGCYDVTIKFLNKITTKMPNEIYDDGHIAFEEELYFPEKSYKEYDKSLIDRFKEKFGF